MKKISAILILGIMLFNIAGYRWAYSFLEKNATAILERVIDSGNYTEEQLVEIQIPLNMPYYSDKDFETVYGETDWNGNHYRFVKRKISGNILYLLCIPNSEKNQIIFAKNDFTKKGISDSPQNNVPSKQPSSFFKILLSDFISRENSIQFSLLINQPVKYFFFNSGLYSQFDPKAPFEPPKERVV
ncbi:MAG TPA: hypothetical protein VI548_01760 [Chitinophagaceae bacterium]|nr:hypothetical protein [Chitinophagaceae bacterium]